MGGQSVLILIIWVITIGVVIFGNLEWINWKTLIIDFPLQWVLFWLTLGLFFGLTGEAVNFFFMAEDQVDKRRRGVFIQHFSLRVILYLNGYTPWNYARFLNYATDRLFLQRVGGGYRFIHRYLQEHFASRYRESSK